MSPTAVIILIVVIVVVIAAIAFGVNAGRRRKLQSTFGPEYDRVVEDTGNRAEAEKELRERERRHAELELKPLSPESQARYSADWEEVQIQFVDNPEQAVTTADDLVGRLMSERGYPTGDYDERLANLSVEHARTLGHYREAHEISQRNQNGEASTEDLRQALVHYLALFADLLGTQPVATDSAGDLPGAHTAHSAGTVGAAGTAMSDDRATSADTADDAGDAYARGTAGDSYDRDTDTAAYDRDTAAYDRDAATDSTTRDVATDGPARGTTTPSDADRAHTRPDGR